MFSWFGPLGSKRNPFPIRSVCVFGESSTHLVPVIAEALTGKRTKERNFKLTLDGKELWVSVSPHGLYPSEHRGVRIAAGDIEEPGVLISPLQKNMFDREKTPNTSKKAVDAYFKRLDDKRVFSLAEPPLRALYPYGARLDKDVENTPPLEGRDLEIFFKFKKELLDRLRTEWNRHKRLQHKK